jgi:uncharacterized membrane protein
MSETLDYDGIREALAETRRHVFSHHAPSEWYRCYTISLRGRTLRVCARCSGIYPGIVSGAIFYVLIPTAPYQRSLVFLFPTLALLDWSVTTFTQIRGWNAIRTLTGLALGFAYGLGSGLVLVEHDWTVVLIGAIYGITAGIVLRLEHKRKF